MYGEREAAVVIGFEGEPLLWWIPDGRSAGYIPPVYEQAGDLDTLLRFIIDNHEQVWGVAHTHPGSGLTGPSSIDLQCFVGVEMSISKPYPAAITRLPWWIATSDDLVLCQWCGPGPKDYSVQPVDFRFQERNKEWLHTLRWHTSLTQPPEEG